MRYVIFSTFLLTSLACGTYDEDAEFTLDQTALASSLTHDPDSPLDDAPEGEATESAEGQVEEATGEDTFSEGDSEGYCRPEHIRERILSEYDEDGDGVLSFAEKQKLRQDASSMSDRPNKRKLKWAKRKLRKLKWVYDADESKSLDENEKANLRSDLRARCLNRKAAILAEFDLDDDGVLNDEEKENVKTAWRAKKEARKQELLEAHDTNGDGILDEQEKEAAKDARKAHVSEKRQALKAQFDTDQDGVLSLEERTALREHLRTRIRLDHLEEEGMSIL